MAIMPCDVCQLRLNHIDDCEIEVCRSMSMCPLKEEYNQHMSFDKFSPAWHNLSLFLSSYSSKESNHQALTVVRFFEARVE
jgi:hypothetical protein